VEHNVRLGGLISGYVPELGEGGAREFAAAATIFVTGLWPFANPSPAVVAAMRHPGLDSAHVEFGETLSRAFTVLMAGLIARPATEGRTGDRPQCADLPSGRSEPHSESSKHGEQQAR
jgi:hypothetical protein